MPRSQMGSQGFPGVRGSPRGWSWLEGRRFWLEVREHWRGQFWKQASHHQRILLESHLTSGERWREPGASQDYVHGESLQYQKGNHLMMGNIPLQGQDTYLMRLQPKLLGLPSSVGGWGVLEGHGRWSFLPRIPNQGGQTLKRNGREVSSWTVNRGNEEISGSTWRVLTNGRGGYEGHVLMTCLEAPQ